MPLMALFFPVVSSPSLNSLTSLSAIASKKMNLDQNTLVLLHSACQTQKAGQVSVGNDPAQVQRVVMAGSQALLLTARVFHHHQLHKPLDGDTAALDRLQVGDTAALDRLQVGDTAALYRLHGRDTAALDRLQGEATAALDRLQGEATAAPTTEQANGETLPTLDTR